MTKSLISDQSYTGVSTKSFCSKNGLPQRKLIGIILKQLRFQKKKPHRRTKSASWNFVITSITSKTYRIGFDHQSQSFLFHFDSILFHPHTSVWYLLCTGVSFAPKLNFLPQRKQIAKKRLKIVKAQLQSIKCVLVINYTPPEGGKF